MISSESHGRGRQAPKVSALIFLLPWKLKLMNLPLKLRPKLPPRICDLPRHSLSGIGGAQAPHIQKNSETRVPKKRLAFAASILALAAAPAAAHDRHDCLDQGCTIHSLFQAEAAGGATVEATRYGSWGFDTAGMDRSVKPGDDYYAFVNGTWARNTQIPADRSSFGAFAILRDLSEARLRNLVESYRPGAPGDEGKAAALYQGFASPGWGLATAISTSIPSSSRSATATCSTSSRCSKWRAGPTPPPRPARSSPWRPGSLRRTGPAPRAATATRPTTS
jgi:hypothetical protein